MIFKKTEVYGYVNLGGEAVLGSEVVSIIKSNSELKLIKNDSFIGVRTCVCLSDLPPYEGNIYVITPANKRLSPYLLGY